MFAHQNSARSRPGRTMTKAAEMNEEVDKLTKIVNQNRVPDSTKNTKRYQKINKSHPVIDLFDMPLPFDSKKIDRFHDDFDRHLMMEETSKRKKKRMDSTKN